MSTQNEHGSKLGKTKQSKHNYQSQYTENQTQTKKVPDDDFVDKFHRR